MGHWAKACGLTQALFDSWEHVPMHVIIFSWVQWFAILLDFWILMTKKCRPVF
jgi:hypothetical protein